MSLPSFREQHISQNPALHLLQNLGYEYVSPEKAVAERRGRRGGVILENILDRQLRRLNKIRFKGAEYEFSDTNIKSAVQALKDVPFDGLVRTSENIYDILTLGKSFEQTIDGDKKSFTVRYIDWETPANNVFHVTDEFEVERTGSRETCRPDLVLFVNGIPFVVIECKRPDTKDPLGEAISQQLRNQHQDYIPQLFTFAQILLAITKNEASYATTGTPKEFWAVWREKEESFEEEVAACVNGAGPASAGRLVTEQDRALFSLCRPERLLELAYKFIVFDAGEKKIARYQQYFAVKNTLERIRQFEPDGARKGGVIWHTQGSGKSLTMVMLAKAIALEPGIRNPRIVLVTDRVDLDDQLYNTFHYCGKEPVQARTGTHLYELLSENKESIVTTTIHKFESLTKTKGYRNESSEIFVLVDEGHRSNYKEFHQQMRKALPEACYIGFTGTPLFKSDKNTVRQFGGFIDTYNIRRAVEDKAVVPLLYEGRHVLQEVDEKAIDKWFEVVTKPLTGAQRADLKRKFSTANQLNKAERKVYLTAYDISEHFSENFKNTGAKGQLAAADKKTALKFKKYLDEFGMVTSEVLISPPDTREGNDTVETAGTEEVQVFWKQMMDRFGTEADYNKQIINSFKHGDKPEIIIVVSKLLTGFDAPRNTVLYICKSLKEHELLQAIARVNRLSEGKDFGYVVDYYGVLEHLGEAMETYGGDFDPADVEDSLVNIAEEAAKLPQKHSELWDIFKEIVNREDEEAYERLLADEAVRTKFYDKFSVYNRVLSVALMSTEFYQNTPEGKIVRYKRDLGFFQKLRASVKKRYSDVIDYSEYEPRVQKLIDTHVDSAEVLKITPPVNIFDQEDFRAEVEKLESTAARADTIASRTQRTIMEKMEEDPVFYRRFSEVLEEAIRAFREKRITDAEYLARASEVMNSIVNRTGDDLPPALRHNDVAKAFYGVVADVLGRLNADGTGIDGHQKADQETKEIAAAAALEIDEIIRDSLIVNWPNNDDVQNAMRNQIDDYLYELKREKELNLDTGAMDLIIETALDIARARYA